jgi:hypothetical protein
LISIRTFDPDLFKRWDGIDLGGGPSELDALAPWWCEAGMIAASTAERKKAEARLELMICDGHSYGPLFFFLNEWAE